MSRGCAERNPERLLHLSADPQPHPSAAEERQHPDQDRHAAAAERICRSFQPEASAHWPDFLYVEKAVAVGRRPELTGGGLIRSVGGWGALKSLGKGAAAGSGHKPCLLLVGPGTGHDDGGGVKGIGHMPDDGDQGGLPRRIVRQEPRDRLGKISDKFSPVPSRLSAVPPPENRTGPTVKEDTKRVSLQLFQRGVAIHQIAAQRGLTFSTIEGHLAFFVAHGESEIGKVVADEKRRTIEQKSADMQGPSLKELKTAVGANCSYGEIKMVLAHLKHLEKTKYSGS